MIAKVLSVVERPTTAGIRYEVVDGLGFSVGVPYFETHAAAWKWIDDQTELPAEDRRRRIGLAFSRGP